MLFALKTCAGLKMKKNAAAANGVLTYFYFSSFLYVYICNPSKQAQKTTKILGDDSINFLKTDSNQLQQ